MAASQHFGRVLEKYLLQHANQSTVAATVATRDEERTKEVKTSLPDSANVVASRCRACKGEIALLNGTAKIYNPDGSDHAMTCELKSVLCKSAGHESG